jgi:hypothetical protein
VNVLRLPEAAPRGRTRFFDFLHEREWRVPSDIPLDLHKPVALVLPEGSAWHKFAGDKWEQLVKAAFLYGAARA